MEKNLSDVISVRRVSGFYIISSHITVSTLVKNLSSVNIVTRVSISYLTWRHTSVFTLEKNLFSVNIVTRVSVILFSWRDTSGFTLEKNPESWVSLNHVGWIDANVSTHRENSFHNLNPFRVSVKSSEMPSLHSKQGKLCSPWITSLRWWQQWTAYFQVVR